MMRPDWQNIIKWWPLIMAIFLLIVAGVETRFQVEALRNDRSIDVRQWELIRSQGYSIVDHERRLQEAERHITPAAIQRWGEIQRMVEDHETDLKEHLRAHR